MREFLKNGTVVFVDEVHRFGTDAMLLSHFCRLRRLESALDLCSGCGIIPLRFIDGGAKGHITAIEIQPKAAELLSRAKSEQHIDNLEIVCGDLAQYKADRLFDVVSCNPPYFDSGLTATVKDRAVARHEKVGLLESVVSTAARALKDKGRFCICHRPERIVDIFCLMRSYGLEPKRLQLVKPKYARKPYLALIDARKAGGVGLHLLPDLVIEARNGRHTRRVMEIYEGG